MKIKINLILPLAETIQGDITVVITDPINLTWNVQYTYIHIQIYNLTHLSSFTLISLTEDDKFIAGAKLKARNLHQVCYFNLGCCMTITRLGNVKIEILLHKILWIFSFVCESFQLFRTLKLFKWNIQLDLSHKHLHKHLPEASSGRGFIMNKLSG